MQVLVVGARDESSLPVVWWQNLLCSLSIAPHIRIEMLGPDISSEWDKNYVEYSGASCVDTGMCGDSF